MSRFWNERLQQLTPYIPGEQPQISNLVKLNTNEHPFGPSEAVTAAIRDAADERLRLYPDPDAADLREAIADWFGLEASQVFPANGSDEVLAFIFQGLFQPGEPVLFPDISYSFYPVYCGLYGLESRAVALDDDLCIPAEAFQPPNGGVIFPNPNAPTGRFLDLSSVEQILAANPDRVVVIDEAYVDFGGESAACLIPDYPNLLVTQSLSKSRSLAGLRVGFALGQKHLIKGLERIKNSFNSYTLDRPAQAGATAAFRDVAGFREGQQAVIEQRERLSQGLEALGFEVVPSRANFVFCRHPAVSGSELAALLRERHIIVRHFDKPRIEQYLRVTIGTGEEMGALLAALDAILNNGETRI
ncbi:histidinol-phosphate transaminase [Salicola sp. Rm-C-2C1-2]|uniref:histidinol-phosphate transaminase n=1 Tax=Salicola sp. Rm-C-2C1-2 TaxID=3141321 RepID=UPI0032E51071